MNEPNEVLATGTKIQTHKQLEAPTGFIVKARYLEARRTNSFGVVGGFVPGHGGDVYWVRHDDGEVAVYGFWEFELVQ